MIPGPNFSVISVLLMIPLKGNPLANPYNKSVTKRAQSPAWGSHTYFGDCHDVGTNTAVFGSEVLSGPPETRLNFIQDQEDPIFIAQFAKGPQVRRRSGNISAFPENRLNQNRGNFFGVYLLGKKQVELIERFLDDLFFRR